MTVDVLVMYIQTHNKHIQHRRRFTDTDISIYGTEELRWIVCEGMGFNTIFWFLPTEYFKNGRSMKKLMQKEFPTNF